jgi:hypothetical protein
VNYLTAYGNPARIIHAGSMAARPWREWEWPEYNKIFAWVSKIPYDILQPNDEEYRTFLEDKNGFIDIPLDALPIMSGSDDEWFVKPLKPII